MNKKVFTGDIPIIPDGKSYRPIRKLDGSVMGGDQLLCEMCDIANAYEDVKQSPVPGIDPAFIAWLRQAKEAVNNGTIDSFYKQSIVPSSIY